MLARLRPFIELITKMESGFVVNNSIVKPSQYFILQIIEIYMRKNGIQTCQSFIKNINFYGGTKNIFTRI